MQLNHVFCSSDEAGEEQVFQLKIIYFTILENLSERTTMFTEKLHMKDDSYRQNESDEKNTLIVF